MDDVHPTSVSPPPSSARRRAPAAQPLWLAFVNTDDEHHGRRVDVVPDFGAWLAWLVSHGVMDPERAQLLARRAQEQPMGAAAALVDARRVRAALRALAERGATPDRARDVAAAEINRVLERSSGTRRLEDTGDGYAQSFRAGGDVFGALLLPVVESAADALVTGEVAHVRRCEGVGCARVFRDDTRNHSRRWCDMRDCGNRAKAARHRARTS